MTDMEKFIALFKEACDFRQDVEVQAETEFAKMPQWDSLAGLSVIVMFDNDYEKSVTGEKIKACKTISDLFQLTK